MKLGDITPRLFFGSATDCNSLKPIATGAPAGGVESVARNRLKRFATICNFGKLNLEKDTIPKPGGLGSRGPSEGSAVRYLFGLRSADFRWMFSACSIGLYHHQSARFARPRAANEPVSRHP